jgi:hypothetical protein
MLAFEVLRDISSPLPLQALGLRGRICPDSQPRNLREKTQDGQLRWLNYPDVYDDVPRADPAVQTWID